LVRAGHLIALHVRIHFRFAESGLPPSSRESGLEGATVNRTKVLYRDDVEDLTHPECGATEEEIEEILDIFPVRAYERLKQYTDDLCKTLRVSPYRGTRAILVLSDATVCVGDLEDLLKAERLARYATLVLPPGVGHLDTNGMVDWTKEGNNAASYDVSAIKGDRGKSKEGTIPDGYRKRLTIELKYDDDTEPLATWVYYSIQHGQRDCRATSLTERFLPTN
jgi:hypothetical protein